MVPSLWSLVKVAYDKYAVWGITHWVPKRQRYLEEIEVRREDQKLYKFKEGDFSRLKLCDIEDIRVVILKRVEDLQLGVESYQKKLNITKPETFMSDISDKTPYTAYYNP
ncbi:hypothetical protein Tco_0407022 [Tanacetum coccineum]